MDHSKPVSSAECSDVSSQPSIMVPVGLRCEYLENPLGIDSAKPRLSWIIVDAGSVTVDPAGKGRITVYEPGTLPSTAGHHQSPRGIRQTAYRVLAASSAELLKDNKGDLWDSGKVASDRSFNIVYDGKPLASRQVCWWKVGCWHNGGATSRWSEPASFEMGLLEPACWKAQWIGMGGADAGTPIASSPLLRKEIRIDGEIKRARAYMSGLGWGELYINGRKVSDDVLSPGLTDYSQEVQYCVYDVASLLRRGANAIGMMLGNGWFSAANILPWEKGALWSDRPQGLLQLVVTYADGTEADFSTDATWKVAGGAIVSNQKNPGEEYDARLEKPQWNTTGYDDSQWTNAALLPPPKGRLTCRTVPPMRVQDTFPPFKLTNDGKGGWLFEFDRHFSGWVRLNVNGRAGSKITLEHEDGERDSYVLKGDPAGEVYEPRFTFHPVRHVRVLGLEGEPTLDTLAGREVYSDVDLYGDFACSNDLLNRIHGNIQRTLKVSLKGFILDCVHREPIAYNEPASISASLSTRKFMPGLWAETARGTQLAGSENGDLSDVVPRLPGMKRQSDVSQNASYPMLVWYLYQCYGDERLLQQHYETVKAWVDFIGRDMTAGSRVVTKGWLGEHMLPGRETGQWMFISDETPKDFIWTCFYYQNARVLAKMSRVLGRQKEESFYEGLAEEIRTVINQTWLDTTTGHYATRSQTAEILPLSIGLVPQENRQQLIDNIARTIAETDGGRLRVGHVGLPGFMESLVENGLGELVYEVVNTTRFPGWGYMIAEGATTVWEGWGIAGRAESMMMLAGVCRFLYEGIAGIQEPPFYGNCDFEPGYGHIRIKPHVLGDLKHAGASIRTIRGIVSSRWAKTDTSFVLDVTIPANATAEVSVPVTGAADTTITEGGQAVWKDGAYAKGVAGITAGRLAAGHATFSVGSGQYRFKVESGQVQSTASSFHPAAAGQQN